MNSHLKRNPPFNSYQDVIEVNREFSELVNLHYFCFTRVYPTGKFLNWANDQKWSDDHYLRENKLAAAVANYDEIQSGIVLLTGYKEI